jgi:hypothetical protein
MYKTPGKQLEVWEEHRRNNPGSFSTTFGSDDWALHSGHYQLSPARVAAGQTLQHDTTAYPGPGPAQQSWAEQEVLTHPSPAQVAAGRAIRNGSFETGSLT